MATLSIVSTSRELIGVQFLETPSGIDTCIQEMAKQFADSRGQILEGTCGLEYAKTQDDRHFFAVHKDRQIALDFAQVKAKILQKLKLLPETKCLQVIGDCARFSPQGTEAGRIFLNKWFENLSHLILWGYTGSEAAATKQALFTAAWSQFIEKKLWLKLKKAHFTCIESDNE